MLISPLHEGSDRRWSSVENRDTIIGNQLPETIGLRPIRSSLVHEAGCTVGERSVDEVAVTGDPTNVSSAPVNILLTEVEDVLG